MGARRAQRAQRAHARTAFVAGVAAVVLAAAVLPGVARATPPDRGGLSRHTLDAGPTWPARDYLLYAPRRLAPVSRRSLVVFLHGCTQSADEAAAGVGWNELADDRGFVAVYPEQYVPQSGELDGSSAQCWNWGQPLVFPRGEGELESVAKITRLVARQHRVRPGRVYVIGVSAGAMMASAMAATYPDLYAATGSVLGCGYPCGEASGRVAYMQMGEHARAVPAFLVSGSADYLVNPVMSEAGVSQWVGTNDLADNGEADGSLSPIPTIEHRGFERPVDPGAGDLCVRNWNNPCPAGAVGWDDYPTTIRRYAAVDGTVLVEAWLLHGLSHNYPGADAERPPEATFTDPHGPDVTTAAFEFFERHAR